MSTVVTCHYTTKKRSSNTPSNEKYDPQTLEIEELEKIYNYRKRCVVTVVAMGTEIKSVVSRSWR